MSPWISHTLRFLEVLCCGFVGLFAVFILLDGISGFLYVQIQEFCC